MTSATERVGRYQLLEPIGVGPSGSVSRAKVFGVAGFERQFAVKRFHNELTAQPAMASALSTAARGYGSLEHPRIARMSEFGVAQGMTFTAVEYVAGLDALRLIAEAKLSGSSLAAGGALALVSQAARAIGYAHGRGLTHLGLAPTNVIVTADGDIKITDFGILAATLPPRPTDSVRLAHRIQYLAPEQLANEATSAATDVFALGVLAYELVTGQRTFKGDTPAQIAQSVMAGPPAEPPLPRPIVRVLQRCLARSPFERFPDARALADALDAALRVAPVPGTRKDIGAQVQATLDRIAAMNEGELSGMLALDISTGPTPKLPVPPPPAPVPALGRESAPTIRESASTISRESAPPINRESAPTIVRESKDSIELATLEFVRPDVHVPGPTPLVGPASMSPATTMPDIPKPFTTVAGIAPPPIPVPPGITSPPGAPPPPAPGGTNTLLGIPSAKAAPPAVPIGKLELKRPSSPAVPPSTPSAPTTPPSRPTPPPRAERSSAVMRAIHEAEVIPPSSIGTPLPPVETDADDHGSAAVRATDPGLGTFSEKSAAHRRPTDEMPPLLVEAYSEALTKPTREMEPLVAQAWKEEALAEFPNEAHVTAHEPLPPRSAEIPIPATTTSAPLAPTAPPVRPLVSSPSRAKWLVAGVVGVAALGAGGWFAYEMFFAKSSTEAAAPQVAAPQAKDAGASANADAAVAIARPADAAVAIAKPADAGASGVAVPRPAPDAGVKSTTSDSLAITSTPSRARVFLDGADVGTTPLKLPGTPDRHTIAVLLPNHELYVAQVDGHGSFAIPLKEVTPSGGPAGIKVIRCKDKDRYYVFVDGKPTGMTCPTERIEVELGPHTVEVYDVVSDSRRKFEVDVKDTRLSVRVKIE